MEYKHISASLRRTIKVYTLMSFLWKAQESCFLVWPLFLSQVKLNRTYSRHSLGKECSERPYVKMKSELNYLSYVALTVSLTLWSLPSRSDHSSTIFCGSSISSFITYLVCWNGRPKRSTGRSVAKRVVLKNQLYIVNKRNKSPAATPQLPQQALGGPSCSTGSHSCTGSWR